VEVLRSTLRGDVPTSVDGRTSVTTRKTNTPDGKRIIRRHRRANNIPKKFLDAILGDLRNAGVVHSKKGPGGGYMLARTPSEIKVGLVIRTLDGPLAPIACASRTAYQPCQDCDDVKACAVRLTMVKVRDAMAGILDRLTIADMLALEQVFCDVPYLTIALDGRSNPENAGR
jgi:Rrf2 family protein